MDGAPILQPPNNMPKKLNDCYFFYYSTCKNGDLCPFRHETSALGCEITCLFWKQGKCMNQSCNLRHMELKDRKMIQCYWEDQPTGCQKAHCPFRHKNPKFGSLDLTNAGLLNQNLINSTTYQDLNASALSELSAVLGTSALGLDGNLLLPLATGLTSTLLSDVTTQTLIHVKEPKLNVKQKEIDKIRMEKVLEKAKEIERQISSLEGGGNGDGGSAAADAAATDDKNSSKKDSQSLKKSSSGDDKSKRTTRSRTRSRSRSRNRSRSSHRHHHHRSSRSSRSPITSSSSSSSRHRSSSRRHRRSSRSRSRSRRKHHRSRSRSDSRSRSRKHRKTRSSSSRDRSSPHKKKSSSSTSSSSNLNNKDHSDTKVSSTSSSTNVPTTTKQSSSSSVGHMTTTSAGSMIQTMTNANGSD